MLILLSMIATLQVKAGPLDAFQANHAAIHAAVDFEQRFGTVDRDLVTRRKLWDGDELSFAEDPGKGVAGRWECDGTAEHIFRRLTDEAAKLVEPTRPGQIVPLTQPFEHLDDGEVVAYHFIEKGAQIIVTVREDSGLVRAGPFNYFGEAFVTYLNRVYPGIEPKRKHGTRGGYACELAIYRQESPEGLIHSIEIAYDPSVGYLPRFIREVGRLPKNRGVRAGPLDVGSLSLEKTSPPTNGSDFTVTETCLVEARLCQAGGFVPMQWRQVGFQVDNFDSRYPDYSDETVLTPSSSVVGLTCFKASHFKDLTGPVRLDQLEGVRVISGIGGTVPIPPGTLSLTLDQAKSLLGRKLTQRSAVILPNIDEAELHEFDRSPTDHRWTYSATMLAVVTGLLVTLVVRKRRAAALLIALLALTGCGSKATRVVKLNGAFLETRFVYDASRPTVPLTMVLRNEGTVPLRVLTASGGCACRKVDQAGLPAVLDPGRNLRLGVSMSKQGEIPGRSLGFQIDTDQGTLDVPIAIDAMPDHQFSPSTATLNNLLENDEEQFELTHRHVFAEGKPTATVLESTPGLSINRIAQREGRVAEFPGFEYRDTTYVVKVEERGLGLHRGAVSLLASDRKQLLEVPIVWKRIEFLTTVPDRVSLAERPLRVFLRCPDLEVELRRVESAPDGVKAVISSPRELTVQLAEGAPGVIEGVVTVSTTSKGRPPLKIPVVRYTSSAGSRTVMSDDPRQQSR